MSDRPRAYRPGFDRPRTERPRTERPYRSDAGGRDGGDRRPSDRFDEGEDRIRHDDPPIATGVNARQLDREARQELRSLSEENAEWVGQHLVMAGRLIDSDPELAHKHAQSAVRKGGRVGVVRETLGITAYATGDFALALRELRTYRRITGRDDELPLMVDSERGIGRPEKALELGRSVDRAGLDTGVRVELAVAMSGARLDLGQAELALRELEIPELTPDTAFPYSAGLFAAYATVLEELGRETEAADWWRRADLAADAFADDDVVEVEEEEISVTDADAAAEDDDADTATHHAEGEDEDGARPTQD
ncbi:hypothetical protein QT381_15010 [Galbitalea sp. SE-J8]|uniref:hypothetical protein n=1 Tax=Galbitalea sp. SE-J8 TaxID=3054952 RepID=UPI00259CE06D|nr:hypothetical protein [Galbitalea sp. SE-J8]MDM4764314.1 hypothetical protein [Galbitalea sp. SE-J8]